jgi:cytochrome c peroxidase
LASALSQADSATKSRKPATTLAAAFAWHLPLGFPVPFVPADNPMSADKVALGKRLFFEPRLSVSGQHSCASCHDPSRAFTDGRAASAGATGQALPHSAMSLVNVAYNVSFGWNQANVRSLEAQMREPLFNEHPIELGLKGRESEVLTFLRNDASYRQAFAAVFSHLSMDNLIKAIAAYERTLISGDSAFDRYVFSGDHAALSDEAKRGMNVFFSERTACSSCHFGFNFSGHWRDEKGKTGEPTFASNGVTETPMRVPTLRNIALTAPYMHDGRFASLDAVLDHYATRTQLSATERQELRAFLESL